MISQSVQYLGYNSFCKSDNFQFFVKQKTKPMNIYIWTVLWSKEILSTGFQFIYLFCYRKYDSDQ